MYEVITKAKYNGKIYGAGEKLPEGFSPDKSWITQGIVKLIVKAKPIKKQKGDIENGR